MQPKLPICSREATRHRALYPAIMISMMPVATPDAAAVSRRNFTLAMLVLGGVCALLAAWVTPAGSTAAMRVLVAALVLVPALVGAWLLARRPRTTASPSPSADMPTADAADPQAAQALQRARRDRELLVAALDMLPIGLAIYDQRDRRVLHNRFLGQLVTGLDQQPRSPYADLLQLEREMGVKVDTAHAALQGSVGDSATLLQYPGDRWIQGLMARNEDGLAIVARTDVTELVRAEHLASQANEQLTLQSTTDGLTGITNRRRFDEVLGIEWLRAARNSSCMSLMIVDIDHFKRFNDHYGHVAGDECLRQVAALLQACARRAGEIVARYGGEEFVILLPGAGLAQAEDLARLCLDGIARIALPHASSPTADHVTFSIGIAHVFPSASGQPAALVNAADTAMYRAKMGGRARYAVADLADWEIDKDAPRTTTGDLL
jgi:diguanylate cyclase (GGDEF)-like protein